MALLLKGGPVAEAMCRRFQAQCDTLKANGIMPVFGIVRVGDSGSTPTQPFTAVCCFAPFLLTWTHSVSPKH